MWRSIAGIQTAFGPGIEGKHWTSDGRCGFNAV
jgi:hypothetical protein